jgi:hypothetical protein
MTLTACLTLSSSLLGLAALLTWSEYAVLQWQTNVRVLRIGSQRLDRVVTLATIAAATSAVVLSSDPLPRWLTVAWLAFVNLRLVQVTKFGREGSDEIQLVTSIALAIALAPGMPSVAVRLALGFLAIEVCLAYEVSALAKLVGREWRRGTAVANVLSGEDYGQGWRALHSQAPAWSQLLSWGTIAFEAVLPLTFVVGGVPALVGVCGAIAFHSSLAVMMRLNRFVLSFAATYPAILWVAAHYGLFH